MKMAYSFHDYNFKFRWQHVFHEEFITDIMKGEYGDVWGETLTVWGEGEDTFGIKAKIVSELRGNDHMKQEIIAKAVEFGVFFWEVYQKGMERNAGELRSLKYQLKNTFNAILRLLEAGVEDILEAWNYLKKYPGNKEWDTNMAIKEDGDIQRAIVKKFVHSDYYEQKLKTWVASEGKREKRKVKQRIVDELKEDVPLSIDVIGYTVKQSDIQKDGSYTDMYTDDSEFDRVFFYIFNCIASVLGSGAANTRSSWDTLKKNEYETKHGMYCFNVKAAMKSIPITYSDPMDAPGVFEREIHVASLLQLLHSHILL